MSHTFGFNRYGELTISIDGGEPVNLGDAMNVAEHIVRLEIQRETNTRMGTSEHRQARKLKAIRKAMGFAYP